MSTPPFLTPPPLANPTRKHYVNSIVEKLPAENLHLNTKIVGITPHESSVTLIEDNGTRHEYDYVILALVPPSPSIFRY